ncbi:MAG: Ig-like domain-containing protein, partial [Candidatus Ornithomonoglobus sp.]
NNGYAFDYAMNVPGELMKITSKSQSGTRVDYNLQVSTTDGTTVIAAAYNDDNTLHELRTAEVKDNTAQLTIDIPNEESAVKFMLWDSLEGMKPITEGIISENNPAVSAITLNYNNYPLVVGNASKTDFSDWETRGSTVTLSAAVGSGSEYTASDITWSSADPSIATVSAAGKVQGRTTGVTRIFASLPNGDTKACDITVIDNVTRLTVQRIEFNADELKLAVGSSAELIPIIYPKEVYDNGVLNKSLIWSSSDESVAAVENGVVTAKTAGTAVITAVSADVGRTGAMTVTVSDNITAETISGPENTVGMRTGESTQLYAGEGDIIWTSDNSYIADVDETGVVTAYSNSKRPAVGTDGQVVFENGRVKYEDDTVKIYATAKNGGETKVFNVSVADAEASVQSVAVNKSEISIANGTTAELTAAILPANLIDKEVVWSSSNESVARVTADGRTIYGLCKADIDGITAGTAVITAECDGKTAECTVTVTNGAVKVSEIRISGKNEIDLDEYTELKAEVTANANNKELAWISADRSIATVNNEGTVMGWGAGTVKIYAVAIDGVDADSAKLLEKARTVTADEVEALGGVTAEFELTVKDSSSYLRWVHAPEEGITEDSVNILWSRASGLDTAELADYEVYVNGVKTDSVTTEGYTIKKLAADTDYSIDVKAVDAGGRVLAQDCIAVRTKPRSEVINVLDYGAVGNGRVTDTYAIQKAIDACPENGTVLLPEGYVFYSGALFLKSNMTFKVDGILLGSAYDKDYPFIVTRWEGWRKLYQTAEEWANTTSSLPENHYPHASLINAGTYDEGENSHTGPYNTENITICGKGQINGNGFTLGYNEGLNQKTGDGGQPEPMTPAMDQTIRGRLITIHNCDGIYMKDVMIAYGPSWTIHPIYSRNMTFDAIPIVSKGDGMTGAADDICILNGDGIDPDSSVNVNIFNINFCTGDDGVAVKTGRNKEGNDLDKPTAYLRITDCISDGSKGAFAFGSENASGVHDAILQNLTVKNIMLSHSVWFKTYWPRGGDTYDIAVRDIDSTKRIDIAANYATSENNPADDPPTYSYLTFENCNPSFVMEGLKATNGRPETYIENVTLRGCTGSGTISYGRNIDIWDVQQSRWTLGTGTTDIHFLYSDSDTNTMLKAAEGAGHISSVNNDTFTIITAIGTTADEILAELESYVPGAELGMELNEDATVLTVTSANGEAVVEYTISYAKVWDFKEYTTEVKTTESGFTEEYDGLTIAIADNGADSDHDKITTAGVYWRGGASSGDSPRYIAYTPVTDGTLEVTGKLNSSGGRWGISDSLDVASLKADQSSTTSTSTATLSLKCSAGTTYYIITKTRSATVNRVCYISE